MITTLLILHALTGTALLGAITHQFVSMLRPARARTASFVGRYAAVSQGAFTKAVVALFVCNVILGAIIYPSYRLDVRIPFEEMGLGWAIGLFELKEHAAGIGLALLPLYAWLWGPAEGDAFRRDRQGITAILTAIVWWDFLVGHILNNVRGLS